MTVATDGLSAKIINHKHPRLTQKFGPSCKIRIYMVTGADQAAEAKAPHKHLYKATTTAEESPAAYAWREPRISQIALRFLPSRKSLRSQRVSLRLKYTEHARITAIRTQQRPCKLPNNHLWQRDPGKTLGGGLELNCVEDRNAALGCSSFSSPKPKANPTTCCQVTVTGLQATGSRANQASPPSLAQSRPAWLLVPRLRRRGCPTGRPATD